MKQDIKLVPLQENDREQFIKDNQEAFKYGATEEFCVRDEHFEEDRRCPRCKQPKTKFNAA